MPLCREPDRLVSTELDYYQRPQQLEPAAFRAWQQMKQDAAADNVTLFLISAFRSLQYQTDLIANKIRQGRSLEQVLLVNAAPGYSEHHTGRAIDIGTNNCPALSEEFENTPAFQWLRDRAEGYKFVLSYPRGNTLGIDYEPWHWCYHSG